MKYSAYWAGCDNFGDKLTEAILGASGITVYSDHPAYAKICGAGSILERFVTVSRFKSYNYPLYIFGTGFDSRVETIGNFNRKLKIYAIRGEGTKRYIEKMGDKKLPDTVALGDIGLLVGKLIKNQRISKKFELGIVPHYVDEDDIRFKQLSDRHPNSKIISVREAPEEFLRQLMECKYVISTAMHPLIACDALRIPNIWAYLPDANQVDMSNKFNDYYSVFGMKKEALILDEEGLQIDLLNTIKFNYDITDKMIELKISELEEALEKMLMDMRRDWYRDIYWKCISKGAVEINKYRRILKKYVNDKSTKGSNA